jgi:uncharacterized protein YbcI
MVLTADIALGEFMDTKYDFKQQVREAVSSFQSTQLAATCESIDVDCHADTLVVTLRGATSPVERDLARDKSARKLLETFYSELFDAIKPDLEAKVQEIIGWQVQRSRLNIDPESGAGVILFTFEGKACPEDQPGAFTMNG